MLATRRDLEILFCASLPGTAIPPSLLTRLLPLCRIRHLATGELLFSRGDRAEALYGVAAGQVEVRFIALNGDVSVIEHVRAGSFFGLAAFATGQCSTYEAVCMRAARLVVMDARAYDFLMDHIPGFSRSMLKELAHRHQHTLQLLESSRHHRAIDRLTFALQQLANSQSQESKKQGNWIFLRITQARIAALANVSRQTANELIREMVRKKRARTTYGGLWIRGASA